MMDRSDWAAPGVLVVFGALLLRRRLQASFLLLLFRLVRLTSPRSRLRLSSVLRFLPISGSRYFSLFIRAGACRDLGRTADSLEATRKLLETCSRALCPWAIVNLAVDSLVSAGLYGQALSVHERWSETAQQRGKRHDEISFATVQINRAEALHNLGLDQQALELLDSVHALARRDPLARNGLLCLRAWILVHDGQLEAARANLSGIEPRGLQSYGAELNYTLAALARESGNLEDALHRAETGLGLARRASSRRNGLFMVAGIAALMGNDARALALFNEAVESKYQAQGGDGLLRFATFLERRADVDGAERVLRLTIERDPESIFAATARTRLGGE